MIPLTNLPNRALFEDRLRVSFARGRRRKSSTFAVLYVDLDRFKNVNESLGHAKGDRLLVAASRRLLKCVRFGDIVARLGGDEFIIILEDIKDRADIESTAGAHPGGDRAALRSRRGDRGVRLGQHRDRHRPPGPRAARAPCPGRRDRDVPGEGLRPGLSCHLRRRHARQGRDAPSGWRRTSGGRSRGTSSSSITSRSAG